MGYFQWLSHIPVVFTLYCGKVVIHRSTKCVELVLTLFFSESFIKIGTLAHTIVNIFLFFLNKTNGQTLGKKN